MMGSVSGRGETLTAVHSTLRESFLASDVAESHQILTLAAVLDDERKSATAENTVVRTLFDIIRTDETPSSGSTSKRTWKLFRERLKRRRNNAANQNPSNGIRSVRRASSFGAEGAPTMLGSGGGQFQRSSSMRLSAALAAEREMMSVSSVEPVRMSLMDMLEDQGGVQEPEDRSDEDEEGGHDRSCEEVAEAEAEEERVGGGSVVVEMVCCVCMVRHKGAAFIPCGHTFCRMCSRELWVKRGNCPLCNNSILEILDIF